MSYYFEGERIGNCLDMGDFLRERHPELFERILAENDIEIWKKKHGMYDWDLDVFYDWLIDTFETVPGYSEYGIVYVDDGLDDEPSEFVQQLLSYDRKSLKHFEPLLKKYLKKR